MCEKARKIESVCEKERKNRAEHERKTLHTSQRWR